MGAWPGILSLLQQSGEAHGRPHRRSHHRPQPPAPEALLLARRLGHRRHRRHRGGGLALHVRLRRAERQARGAHVDFRPHHRRPRDAAPDRECRQVAGRGRRREHRKPRRHHHGRREGLRRIAPPRAEEAGRRCDQFHGRVRRLHRGARRRSHRRPRQFACRLDRRPLPVSQSCPRPEFDRREDGGDQVLAAEGRAQSVRGRDAGSPRGPRLARQQIPTTGSGTSCASAASSPTTS